MQQWLHRRVARLEPDAAERRHRRAHADRRLTSRMDLDGMGSLWMAAGAADIAAIDTHLNGLARQLGGQDPRTMDQRRADLAVDLLTGHYADPATGAASAAGAAIRGRGAGAVIAGRGRHPRRAGRPVSHRAGRVRA
ncbi:MAG: DUF222 domain-containing protein [Micromonosporaceae bacterium]